MRCLIFVIVPYEIPPGELEMNYQNAENEYHYSNLVQMQ